MDFALLCGEVALQTKVVMCGGGGLKHQAPLFMIDLEVGTPLKIINPQRVPCE